MAGSKKRTVSEIMKTEKAEEVEKKSKEIALWIEGQLKEKLPKPNLRESLLDGVVLCKLINALAPGALKRYHKKPRMLAMKIENIGFFLATCKTRMNLPPALLFQPTDIHDDSNNLASMSKVLNVLSFLKGDDESTMIQQLPDEDEDEDGAAKPVSEGGDAGAAGGDQLDEDEPQPPGMDDDFDPEPPAPAPTPSVTAAAPAAVSHHPVTAAVSHPPVQLTKSHGHNSVTDSDFVEVQTEVLKAIVDVINAELSIDSKRKLVKTLNHQITSFEEKIMNASDDHLVSLAKEFGVDEAPKTKGREGTIEILLKYGRVQ
jgi:hypothetical protein